MGPDPAFWRGRSVFLTGHTGFVGGWLAFWLLEMGARITGYSQHPPTVPNLFESTRLDAEVPWTRGDVRDASRLREAMTAADPEIVLHLAAQPLVGLAFCDPYETLTVNVMGTLNVLDCAFALPTLRALVVFTTDKVYAGDVGVQRFREDAPLGGSEPYGLSKASAEFAVAAYCNSSRMRADLGVITVRAGNIVGGGDWAKDRLVPDAIRAFTAGTPLLLRKPEAVRPWQFVLDAVGGLLVLAQAAYPDSKAVAGAWNVGPSEVATHSVAEIADALVHHWGGSASWLQAGAPGVPETGHLEIDSTKVALRLGWRGVWPMDEAIAATVAWYRAFYGRRDMISITRQQIERHLAQTSGSSGTAVGEQG
jgi:CDP-glucose 4,6-dehydratase